MVGQCFDLVASNPPYIDPLDPHLQQGDLLCEPHSALGAEEEGLADLSRIIEAAPGHLNAGGWLLLEHGYDQADSVCEMLTARGFPEVATRRDLGGKQRVSGGRYCAE